MPAGSAETAKILADNKALLKRLIAYKPISMFKQTTCNTIEDQLYQIVSKWSLYEDTIRQANDNKTYYFKEIFDKESGDRIIEANWTAYYKGRTVLRDLKSFFCLLIGNRKYRFTQRTCFPHV